MGQVLLFDRTPYTGGFLVNKMHERKIGFDLVEISSKLANKDEDEDEDARGLKMSSIWKVEDVMNNNKRETEYIHLFDDKLLDNLLAYNPALIDFGLLGGGIIGGPRFSQEFGHMSLGYYDPYYDKTAKRVDLKEDLVKFKYKTLDEWACKAYEP
ncbi:hypothetical protein LguiA_030261 [Lonicera macranthoides]